MPLTVHDLQELVNLLETHPDWRTALRRVVLTDELLTLPEQLAAFRLRTEQQFQALAEAQRQLVEAQDKVESHLATLTTEVTVLARTTQLIINDLGDVKGITLEMDYRFKGHAYFSRVIRRAHVLTSDEIVGLIEDARDHGDLSDAEAQDVLDIDVVVRGKRPGEDTEVYLIVEVSWRIEPRDVERATRRAGLFSRTGITTLPVVAGKTVTHDAAQLARRSNVWQVTNGRTVPPGTV